MSNKPDKNEFNKYTEVLNKLLESEKNHFTESHKDGSIKKTICIFGGLGSLMFIGILCYAIIKSNFSLDGILSTLLAFFSIFISIFFYFKADETSANFYSSSYQFMKDISVTLGKIEERFGEKLNNLNDKLSHLDNINTERSKEIQEQTNDKNKLINELMDKANLNETERNEYKNKLAKAEDQIESLKIQQIQDKQEANRLRENISEIISGKQRMFNSDYSFLYVPSEKDKYLSLFNYYDQLEKSKITVDNKGNLISKTTVEKQNND